MMLNGLIDRALQNAGRTSVGVDVKLVEVRWGDLHGTLIATRQLIRGEYDCLAGAEFRKWARALTSRAVIRIMAGWDRF